MIRIGMFLTLNGVPITADKTYSLSGWFYATPFSPGHCDTVALSCGYGTNYFSATTKELPASSALGQWQQFSAPCSWTATDLQRGTPLITLGWRCGGASLPSTTAATAWIDTVELQEVRA